MNLIHQYLIRGPTYDVKPTRMAMEVIGPMMKNDGDDNDERFEVEDKTIATSWVALGATRRGEEVK